MVTRARNNIFKPKGLFMAQESGPPPLEPKSKPEAFNYPEWTPTLTSEYQALAKNGTRTLVPRQDYQNIISCRWVFWVKRKPDGTIERYKSCLMARGFHQRPCIDYHDTFSPVVKLVTIQTVFTLALSQNWPIYQYDVINAFLEGPLQEEVYMSQLLGFHNNDTPTNVCHLKRVIYGIKQAPSVCYTALSTFLKDQGFVKKHSNASLFAYHREHITLYFLIYVDDLLLTGNDVG
ncbi:Retrovirus-related Pol polyprotein from transposon RE2 [Linum perenne]